MDQFTTLRELFDNSVSKYGNETVSSILGGETLTYNDFNERVNIVRDMLVGAGLSSGDKVAILSNNMPNWGVCYFAVVANGMVAVPILPDFSGGELDIIIEHSGAKALMVSDKLFSKLSKQTVNNMNIVIRTKNLGEISRMVTGQGSLSVPKTDDLAVIIYTSGTTSSPKGVMLSHRALSRHAVELKSLFPCDTGDIFLSILPLSHTLESSLGMIYPFSVGASVVYLDKPPTASYLMMALKKVRPTIFLTVPLIIEKIFNSKVKATFTSNSFLESLYNKSFFRKRLHKIAGKKVAAAFGGRVRFYGIGGAKLNPETEQFLMDAKLPYSIGYGLTETSPLLTGAVPYSGKLESAGPPVGEIKIRLDNVNPETGEGEVVALSPCVMDGYYKNPEATAEVFTEDGWFRTKDLGIIDEDGYLYIKGRANSMIVGPSGENIYPEEIESVLNTHKLVSESIVVEDNGRLVALVCFNDLEFSTNFDIREGVAQMSEEMVKKTEEMKKKTEEMKREIMNYVNNKVSRFSRITEIIPQQGEFEKTPTNKIKRYLYTKGKGFTGAKK